MIDFGKRYRVAGYSGVAFYLSTWATETVYEGDVLVCLDDECDHGLSEMCWAEGDYFEVTSHDFVIAYMVGDDRPFTVDVEDLTPLDDDDYCGGCGQIGCVADAR